MSEPARRSALEGHYRTGRFGARPEDAPGVVVAECRPRSMVQVNGAPDPGVLAEALGASDADVAPNRTFDAGAVRYAWNGPGQWLAESAEQTPAELIEHVEDALRAHGASTTDLSHARTVVRVSGPASTDLLAKLCPIDVESMRTGDSAVTMAGPLNVQVVKSGEEEFRLYVFRSFGLAMWEMLLDEAAEFGGEIVAAGR
jgi:sarcosine oxidase subunit gamma